MGQIGETKHIFFRHVACSLALVGLTALCLLPLVMNINYSTALTTFYSLPRHSGRNLQTGEKLKIGASKHLNFVATAPVKRTLAGGNGGRRQRVA